MASASEVSVSGNNEQLEDVTHKADICDNILSAYRSMPDKAASFILHFYIATYCIALKLMVRSG